MAEGKARKGVGRKSTWVSGCCFEETKLVRVPKALAGSLLRIAHRLDAGESVEAVTRPSDLVADSMEVLVARWLDRVAGRNPKSPRWEKVVELLREIEQVLYS